MQPGPTTGRGTTVNGPREYPRELGIWTECERKKERRNELGYGRRLFLQDYGPLERRVYRDGQGVVGRRTTGHDRRGKTRLVEQPEVGRMVPPKPPKMATTGKDVFKFCVPGATQAFDLGRQVGKSGLCTAIAAKQINDILTSKDTNPKDAVGIRKVPFSTVPARVTAEVGLAFLEGARKYGRHNYRVAGVSASVYYDAAMRHLTEWWEGSDFDEASGLHQIIKAIACLYVLRDSMHNEKLTDDRPPSIPQGWVEGLNRKAAAIIDSIPDAKKPYVKEAA